ncbi:Transposable element P transposase [Amphibalanus amphitrite]|nr:Transposable element P transposase [Amphibalanus amphitrite]
MMQHRGGTLMSIRIEEVDEATGLPVIISNVSVYGDLTYKMHSNGVLVSDKKMTDITKTERFTSVAEVVNVLARVKHLNADAQDHLEVAAQLLDAVAGSSAEEKMCQVAAFASEQLRLAVKPSRKRRYSSSILSNAIAWDRTSPKLYRMMQESAMFCLPTSKTLRRLTSALQVGTGLNSGTMTYLGMRVEKLEPRERLVNLAMDEVYTAQAVEFAGGRLFGETNGVVTKTLFCTHINSVAGKYEDMISMQPVPHVTAANIKETFQRVLKGLTELGFKVVSVTTDNHRANQSWHNSLGADGCHPEYILNPYSEQEERVYTLYDTVHIFKNIYYGLIRSKALTVPSFPDSENSRKLKVSFGHLTRLRNMELGHPGKLAYKLTDKVINPSALERVNVSLAAAATHESTSAALRHFAQHQPGCAEFADTAEFLELVRRWFNACNVKSQFMSHRLRDQNRVALRRECEASDKSLSFLSEFGMYMRSLHVKYSALTKDTCMAAYYTSRGLVNLTKYLLYNYSGTLEYVLLGKIQSDRIESHFGHLRKLSGGNYWSSVRQFLENEAVIRTKGLIWWSGFSPAEASARMAPSRQERQQEDALVIQELVVAVANSAELNDLDDSAKASLGHIAGALARGALARRYYATMIYREIERDLVLLPMMRSFTRLPEQSRTVTATFHLLSYWLRPELDPGPAPDIEGCHRQVARRVLRLVRQRHPRHPLSGWADCKLTPDGPGGWTLTEGRQLLDCINLIVFGQMELTLLKGRLGGELSRICDRNCSVYEEDDFGELSGQGLRRAGPTRQRPPEGEKKLSAYKKYMNKLQNSHYRHTEPRLMPPERRKVFSAYSSYLAGGGDFLGVVSAVYASVAGLLGLELHFILCPDTWLLCWPIGTEDRHIYVDMNQSGAQLTRREACLQLMFQSPDHAPEALLEPVPKHKLLWRLVSGMFCPKDHSLAVADQVSMRLLHYWLFDNCEIHEISMCSMVMVLERSRPMYLHRLSQARLEASHLVENPVAERTALPAYLDRLRADHLRLVKSVSLQRSRDEQMMEAKQWPPPEGFCRFQVGDMVQLGDHPHRRAVVYSVVLRLHLVAGNVSYWSGEPCQLCVVGRLNPPPHHLRVGRYRLLLDGNEKMDVEEDSICASPWAAPIENCELGRYFTGFDGRRYVPLPSLARRARERPDAGAVEEHRPWPRPLRPPPVSWRVAWPRRLPYDVEFQPGDEDAVAAPQEIELGGLVLH